MAAEVVPVRLLAVLVFLPLALGAAEPAFDLAAARVVDLTHPFDGRTLYWPTAPSAFELKELQRGPTPGGFFYSANALCTPEHGGTHLDAPIHFADERRTTDAVPVGDLVRPAIVLDVTAQASKDPDYRLSEEYIRQWERARGRIPDRAIVLLRTGWSVRWGNRKAYLGDDKPGDASNLHFPSYGVDAARFLIEERKVAALGVDTASIDHGPSKDFPVHRLAAAADVPGIENVTNLDQMPARGAWVAALPMKIAGGSGGPLRIVGLVGPEPAAK
jgi:kynurenine formamidase